MKILFLALLQHVEQHMSVMELHLHFSPPPPSLIFLIFHFHLSSPHNMLSPTTNFQLHSNHHHQFQLFLEFFFYFFIHTTHKLLHTIILLCL